MLENLIDRTRRLGTDLKAYLFWAVLAGGGVGRLWHVSLLLGGWRGGVGVCAFIVRRKAREAALESW